MNSFVIAALAASTVLACSPAWAQAPADFSAIDAKLKVCSDRNPSNPGVSNCTVIAKAAADRQLNEVYTEALAALNHRGPNSAPYDPEIPKPLIVAERAWIAFRDTECNYKSAIALGGTLAVTDFGGQAGPRHEWRTNTLARALPVRQSVARTTGLFWRRPSIWVSIYL